MDDSTLMVSISGIRGIFGHGLDPEVLVRYGAAYGRWCGLRRINPVVVIGRDARTSGPVCSAIVMATLQSVGCTVIDAGLASTPTVEMAVLKENAAGGIVLSASHNPEEWNALKLLNDRGEFLSPAQAEAVFGLADSGVTEYVDFDRLGSSRSEDYLAYHIEQVCALDFIEPETIKARDFRVVVDGVNSVGGFVIPSLLRRLGLRDEQIICVNCEPTGRFQHPAEPLPENLIETCAVVAEENADLGIVVDPDVDRLALIQDGGTYFSEELTQVLAADFILGFRPGSFVTNLSSSRAVDDVARGYGTKVYRSAVGEINVVEKMKKVDAVLGGEGNGGIILPDLHYGRDAVVGTAMVLQHLVNTRSTLSEIRQKLPSYSMSKMKVDIQDEDPDRLLNAIATRYEAQHPLLIDGVKIDFPDGWVHLRKSNTEPIIRIYSEASTAEKAHRLGERFMGELLDIG